MDYQDDYYVILDLPRSASDAEIKKAYRKMALRWHPDKNPSNQAEAEGRFKLVSEAYEVLSDPEKRRVYDQQGKFGLDDRGGAYSEEDDPPQYQRDRQQHQHRHQQQHQHQHQHHYHFRDPRDVFRDFFGPGDPFTRIFYNPDPLKPFDESVRNMSERQRASNIGSGFDFGRRQQHASQFQSNIPSRPPGKSSSRLQHSVHRTFTKTVNGRRIVVRTVVEDGVETVTETVDGVVTKHTVNGHPVTLSAGQVAA